MRTRIEKLMYVRAGIFAVFFFGIFLCDWRILIVAIVWAIWYFPPYIEAIFLASLYVATYGYADNFGLRVAPILVVSGLILVVEYCQQRLRISV